MPTPPSPTVLISGASIAGPALAHRLGHHGFRPTVVELAPALREGGHAVDFRGDTHLTVLRRMGLLDALRGLQTGGSPMTFVDQDDTPLLHLPAAFAGGDIEVLRGDLSRTLYEASLPTTEYVFGDSVTGLTETPDGVDVTFRRSPPRTFDLVIGADGIHSHIRRLAFGPEERHVTHLGYYAATWSLPHHPHPDLRPGSVGYNAPGRLAGVGTGHANPARAHLRPPRPRRPEGPPGSRLRRPPLAGPGTTPRPPGGARRVGTVRAPSSPPPPPSACACACATPRSATRAAWPGC
ncbi:FAD-dependent monooxygenase [Streptomyces goshikiensis]|uniref:FAD-dependent monooxygenase n=1 Tax=Streptomyces goshikiensis TaxID=1942 RepID=UPI0036B638FE